MGTATVSMSRIVCAKTTESGHDEVYYSATVVRRRPGQDPFTDGDPRIGPNARQGGDAGGVSGEDSAWDTNDSGNLADRHLGVSLFHVPVAAGENVVVQLTFRESDGQNYAQMEQEAAKQATAVLGAVTAIFPAAAVITAPVGLAVGAVTAVMTVLSSLFENTDDVIGTLSFVLEGQPDGSVHLVQYSSSGLTSAPADGAPGSVTAHLRGDGSDYQFTVAVPGATMHRTPVAAGPTPLPGFHHGVPIHVRPGKPWLTPALH